MPKADDPFIVSDRLVALAAVDIFAAAQQPVAGPYSLCMAKKTRRVWFVPHPCPNIANSGGGFPTTSLALRCTDFVLDAFSHHQQR
jgi:hypothetical protein